MSALAEQWDTAIAAGAGPDAESSRARPARSGRPERTAGSVGQERPASRRAEKDGAARDRAWNVLAEELVAFPPASQRIWLERTDDATQAGSSCATGPTASPAGLSAGERWLEEELERLRQRREAAFAPRPAVVHPFTIAEPEPMGAPAPLPGGVRRHQAAVASPGRHQRSGERRVRALASSTVPTRAGAVLVGPRGLRRLLPGVATLAALAGLWAGAGTLASTSHHVTPTVLPGSVPARGGKVAYTARPGDTLWSIAARVEGNGDPRPLVDELEQQLGGAVLQPGDRLLLPR